MPTHEPACALRAEQIDEDVEAFCICDVIEMTRVEERVRLTASGWMAPGSHEAVRAVSNVRSVRQALTELRAQIEVLKNSDQMYLGGFGRGWIEACKEFQELIDARLR